ncbi:MAG: TetR/AcrR family transcriptional regulator [Firmicutes bacterium]|nr:TetR/AcrR family transcriptional regulator [Bacillota bacterium]
MKERNAEESRRRILQAAEHIFATKGLDGARVDEIAGAAQINKRMLYHYFGDKEELYTEVLRQNFQKIIEAGQEATNLQGSVLEKVTQFISNYFHFLTENDEYVRLIQWESLYHGRHTRKILPEMAQTSLPRLEALLQEGINEGIFRRDLDIRHLVISINAITIMYFSRRDIYNFLWDEDMMSEDALQDRLQHIIDFTLNGILKEGITYEKVR